MAFTLWNFAEQNRRADTTTRATASRLLNCIVSTKYAGAWMTAPDWAHLDAMIAGDEEVLTCWSSTSTKVDLFAMRIQIEPIDLETFRRERFPGHHCNPPRDKRRSWFDSLRRDGTIAAAQVETSSVLREGIQIDPPAPDFDGAKGSKYWIRVYTNERQSILTDLLRLHSLSLAAFATRVEWVSPLAQKQYVEYWDEQFLGVLGLDQHGDALEDFWPTGGPHWDGLAKVDGQNSLGALLVEAKAHPGENNSECKATDPESRSKIERAFGLVQAELGMNARNWFHEHYQLANRIAHLYFLNEVANIPTWLALVNFVNDRTHKPTPLSDWTDCFPTLFRSLGVDVSSRLCARIIPLFIDVG